MNDVINRLDKKTFSFDENKDGSTTFGDYKAKVLQDIRSNLTEQEKSLISFPESDNQKTLNTEAVDIKLHIQSHKFYQDINIFVKLNYDADSIADRVNNKIITVLQTGGYKTSESASKYAQEIKKEINDLLTPAEKQSGYQISGWENATIYWPKLDRDPNQPFPLSIQIGEDKAKAKITLEFQYYEQKKVLDDPREAGPGGGLLIDSMSSADWKKGLAINEINQAWGSLGGIDSSLFPDVVYKQVLKPGEKTQPITNKKEVECEMYFKDGVLGYTQNHPRYFYVEGE